MPRDRQAIGPCSQCQKGVVNCTLNTFVDGALQIHSWEHRCTSCGQRDTTAFRSDDATAATTADPTICPYCGRKGAT